MTTALRRLDPILDILFYLFLVTTERREAILREACAELSPRLREVPRPHAWLLRRIIRSCAEAEAEIFARKGRLPEELMFQEPPKFPGDED